MKHLITERTHAWIVFVEATDIHPLCTIADAVDRSCSGLVSEIRYNRHAGQGIVMIAKSASLSVDRIRKTIEALNF